MQHALTQNRCPHPECVPIYKTEAFFMIRAEVWDAQINVSWFGHIENQKWPPLLEKLKSPGMYATSAGGTIYFRPEMITTKQVVKTLTESGFGRFTHQQGAEGAVNSGINLDRQHQRRPKCQNWIAHA